MKYFAFKAASGPLKQAFAKQFTKFQKQFSAPLEEVFSKAVFYVADVRREIDFLLQREVLVKVFLPESLLKNRPFTLKKEDIVYDSHGIMVVNKPHGLPTQETFKPWEDHLYGALITHGNQMWPKKMNYVGLHHRLDRMTSGLVLFTTKSSLNKEVSRLFSDRLIKKEYMAVVTGDLKEKRWSCKAPIAKLSDTGKTFAFGVREEGLTAHTDFEWVRSIGEEKHLILCRPRTGRTHQIRIHLKESGLPIVGDPVYGSKEGSRMLLHAKSLEFTHPKTQENTVIYCELNIF